jgi:hypothetical protein
MSGQRNAPAALYPRGKDPRYPLYRRLGGPQGLQKKNLSPLPGIEPRSSSPVVRDYTDWATRLLKLLQYCPLNYYLFDFWFISPDDNRERCDRHRDNPIRRLDRLALHNTFKVHTNSKKKKTLISPVNIVSDYRLARLGFDPRHMRKDFPSILCVQTGSETHPTSCTLGTGGSFRDGKALPGRDADHSHHLVLRSRMSRSYIASASWRLHAVAGHFYLLILECKNVFLFRFRSDPDPDPDCSTISFTVTSSLVRKQLSITQLSVR